MLAYTLTNFAAFDLSTGDYTPSESLIAPGGVQLHIIPTDGSDALSIGDEVEILQNGITDGTYVYVGLSEIDGMLYPAFEDPTQPDLQFLAFETSPPFALDDIKFNEAADGGGYEYTGVGLPAFPVDFSTPFDIDGFQTTNLFPTDLPDGYLIDGTGDGVLQIGDTVTYGTRTYEYQGVAGFEGVPYPVFQQQGTTADPVVLGSSALDVPQDTFFGFEATGFNFDGTTTAPIAPELPSITFTHTVEVVFSDGPGSPLVYGEVTALPTPLVYTANTLDDDTFDWSDFANPVIPITLTQNGCSFDTIRTSDTATLPDGTFGIFSPDVGSTTGTVYLTSAPVTSPTDEPFVRDDADTYTFCFAAGTLIATPEGESTVETLKTGDLVITADGRAVPVKWIGRQTLLKLFSGERARPVRVTAGALGNGLPHTDLILTADHALILDGLAVNASALVNGTTITMEPLASLPDRVTYYHVETEDHDVILANGTPAETFIDHLGRQGFDNYAEYIALYGDARLIAEMPLPRISTARLLPPALKARLTGDAAA